MTPREIPAVLVGELTTTEARVLAHVLAGMSGKWTAYELGISSRQVSHCLANAALKLGLPGRRALVRRAAILSSCGVSASLDQVSRSEREVLGLVGLGYTNAQIAALRGRSARTIANQIAALLRKTQATNRLALMVLCPVGQST